MSGFEKRPILVTGARGGIGAATVRIIKSQTMIYTVLTPGRSPAGFQSAASSADACLAADIEPAVYRARGRLVLGQHMRSLTRFLLIGRYNHRRWAMTLP